MFALLETENVWLCVIVVCMLGIARIVVAIVKADVGCRGVAFFFVIFVGGTGCIGANRVKPVCIVYSTPYTLSAGFEGAALPVLSILAGLSVPVTVFKPWTTASGNVPVMPEREKRGEKFVTVPPFVAVDMILKKLVDKGSAEDSFKSKVCRS